MDEERRAGAGDTAESPREFPSLERPAAATEADSGRYSALPACLVLCGEDEIDVAMTLIKTCDDTPMCNADKCDNTEGREISVSLETARLDQPAVGCFGVQKAYCFEECHFIRTGNFGEVIDVDEDGYFISSHEEDEKGIIVDNEAGDHASGSVIGYACPIKGITNLGNTCYLNSLVQCLLVLGRLRAGILGLDAPLGLLGSSLRYLFQDADSVNIAGGLLDPEKLLVCLHMQNSEFEGYSMQDSQQIAERGDSHSLASELEDVVTVKTTEPLKVDSTKMEQISQNKDSVHGPLQTQKDKVQGKAVDVLPQKVLNDVKVDRMDVATADSLIPEDPASPSFVSPLREENALASGSDVEKNDSAVQPEVSTEAKIITSSAKVTTEDKGKTQISDVVYDKAHDINSLASIEECLELHFEAKMIEWAYENCSKVHKVIEHVSFDKILDVGLFMDPSSYDKDNSHSPVGVVEHQGLRWTSEFSRSYKFQRGHRVKAVSALEPPDVRTKSFASALAATIRIGQLVFLSIYNSVLSWLPRGFFWRRGRPQAPEPEFSWISVMGDPIVNIDGSCSIAAATMCIEAQHRLAFERLYGKGSFPCKAKAPNELKKACHRRGIWSSKEGALAPYILLMIIEKGGILTQRVPNNIQLAIDGFIWLERDAAFGKLEFMRLLYAHGPLLSSLWADNDDYDETLGDRVYRGQPKEFRTKDSGEYHYVVCFAYRVDRRTDELYVRIMDNHADDGPIRWILFDVLEDFCVPLIKKPIEPHELRRKKKKEHGIFAYASSYFSTLKRSIVGWIVGREIRRYYPPKRRNVVLYR